jgi:nucleoid DNA-binding protein
MGKISIQDLANVLVERKKLDKREAVAFVTAMFEIVQQHLEKDKLVKVKGLGTFKIIDVDDRESVNVNTGERVLIEGHGKITFIPDALMKELVNKPFSQFETVVLNEGVDFADPELLVEPEPEPEAEVDAAAMPLVDFGESNAIKEEPLFAEVPEPEPEPEPQIEEPVVEEPEVESEFIPELSGELEPVPEKKEKPAFPFGSKSWIWSLLLGLILGIVIGMLIDHFMISQQPSDLESFKPMEEKVEAPVQPKATQPEAEVPETPAQPAEAAPAKPEEPAPAAPETKPAVPDTKPTEPAKKAEPAETLDPYAAKDARVRLGAWRIVGTDQVVKVREGQTLKRLSKFYLGPDMECYVEVYNNLSPNAALKVGQEIKIPKLVHKKSLKKQ